MYIEIYFNEFVYVLVEFVDYESLLYVVFVHIYIDIKITIFDTVE